MFTVYSNHNPFFPFIQPIFIYPHIQLNIIIILQLCLLRLSKILYTSSYHPPFFHIFPQQDCVTSTTVHVTVIWNLSRRLSSLSPIYHLLSLSFFSSSRLHLFYTYIYIKHIYYSIPPCWLRPSSGDFDSTFIYFVDSLDRKYNYIIVTTSRWE